MPLKKHRSKKAEQKKEPEKVLDKRSPKKCVRRQATTCLICKTHFSSKKMLNDHNTKHHFFRHCPNCPKTFQKTRSFILHLRSHLTDQPYVCKICLEGFQQKRVMLEHKKKHSSSEKYSCLECEEMFPNLTSRNSHYLAHEEPPYICHQCNAVFYSIPDKTVHLKNHLYRCPFCPQKVVTFGKYQDLRIHMDKDHDTDYSAFVSTGAVSLEEDGNSDSMEELSSSDDESLADMDNHYQKEAIQPVYNIKRKDKYICFICYVLYPSPELLKSHMKDHVWYPCDSCPRFFADEETFKEHECDFVEVPSHMSKNCTTGAKYDNLEKNLNKTTAEKLRFPIMKYYDPVDQKWLYDFIESTKSQMQHMNITRLNHIGYHIGNLDIILKNKNVRSLYSEECFPVLEDLYSKFFDLSQGLCHQLNRSSKQ